MVCIAIAMAMLLQNLQKGRMTFPVNAIIR